MTVSGGNWAAETVNDRWCPRASAAPLGEGPRTEAELGGGGGGAVGRSAGPAVPDQAHAPLNKQTVAPGLPTTLPVMLIPP